MKNKMLGNNSREIFPGDFGETKCWGAFVSGTFDFGNVVGENRKICSGKELYGTNDSETYLL